MHFFTLMTFFKTAFMENIKICNNIKINQKMTWSSYQKSFTAIRLKKLLYVYYK